MSGEPTPGPWRVYRCDFADPDRACEIHRDVEVATGQETLRSVVCDTNRDECCHMMRLADAQLIVDLRNAAPAHDMLDAAWGIIANAGGGNWSNETPEWVEAAERWRDRYVTSTMHDAPPAPGGPA